MNVFRQLKQTAKDKGIYRQFVRNPEHGLSFGVHISERSW